MVPHNVIIGATFEKSKNGTQIAIDDRSDDYSSCSGDEVGISVLEQNV